MPDLTPSVCRIDGELKINFLPAPIFDAFEPPDHKNHFTFTLGYPWNVQIHFFKFDGKKNWEKKEKLFSDSEDRTQLPAMGVDHSTIVLQGLG